MVAGIPKQMEIDPSCDHQFGRNRNVTDDYFQFMATSSLTTCAESVEFSHARRAKAAPVRFFAWINSSLRPTAMSWTHVCLLLNAMCAKIICEQMQTLGWMICVHRSDASVTAARYHLLPHNHKKGRRKKEPPAHVDTLGNLYSWRKVWTLLSRLL